MIEFLRHGSGAPRDHSPGLLKGGAGLALLALVTACAPGQDLPYLPPAAYEETYRLGPDDQIRIITFGEEQLTNDFRVNDAGNVDVPLLGALPASGLTTTEFAKRMGARLEELDLLKDPSIAVEVVAYRPIFVLGEVGQPGQFPFRPGMTVVTAAATAGGFTYRAVQDYVSVIRIVDGQPVEGRAARTDLLRPGDVVNVYERRF